MVAYNEEKTLSDILSDILAQTYPHASTELVFIDNNSSDRTYEVLSSFRDEHVSEYKDIIIKKNDCSVLSSGLNLGLRSFTGDAFIRIDAHASIAANFVEETVACLNGDDKHPPEKVCGGMRPTYTPDDRGSSRMLLAAEESRFGASAATYRGEPQRCYVDSIFHAAYTREVVERVGAFSEELWRTEDNEYNWRVRQAGYKICFEPKIKSKQQIRSTLSRMLKQKYQNGYWIGRTLGVCPGCLSLFHFVPLSFVLGSVACALLSLFGLWIFGAFMWGAYLACSLLFSIKAIIDAQKPSAHMLLLPVVFLLMHTVYGFGTIRGIFGGALKGKSKGKGKGKSR